MNGKNDTSLFVSPDAVVTRTLVKIANVSYAVAHVNSVFVGKRRAYKAWAGLIIFVVLFWQNVQPFYNAFLNGLPISIENNQYSFNASIVFLILSLICAAYILFPMQALILQMSNGRVQTLETRRKNVLFPIKRAIEQAIDLRG